MCLQYHTCFKIFQRKKYTSTIRFPYGEISLRRNFLTAKFPYGEISLQRNILRRILLRRNILRRNFLTPHGSQHCQLILQWFYYLRRSIECHPCYYIVTDIYFQFFLFSYQFIVLNYVVIIFYMNKLSFHNFIMVNILRTVKSLENAYIKTVCWISSRVWTRLSPINIQDSDIIRKLFI